MFSFAEQDTNGALLVFEGGLEGRGGGDFRDGGAAGLFGGFERDAAPAFGTFEGSLREVFFGSAGEDRGDAGDAKFGGFFDGPLHVVELEDGEEEMEGKRCIGFEFFVEREEDAGVIGPAAEIYSGDFGAVEEPAGD